MLETIPDLPEGVIGFEAVGEVQADDYRTVLIPALDAAAAQGSIRMLYVLGDRFEGYSGGAMWQDTKVGITHHSGWERVALVTDVDWITHLTGLFGLMLPGEVRHFALDHRDEAIAWVAAG